MFEKGKGVPLAAALFAFAISGPARAETALPADTLHAFEQGAQAGKDFYSENKFCPADSLFSNEKGQVRDPAYVFAEKQSPLMREYFIRFFLARAAECRHVAEEVKNSRVHGDLTNEIRNDTIGEGE